MSFVRLIRCVLMACALAAVHPAVAVTPDQIGKLVTEDNDGRIVILNAIAAADDESAISLLQAFAEGNLQASESTRMIVIMADGKGTDAITGKAIDKLPEDLDEVVANNVLRRELAAAIATLKLTSKDREVRLAAAKTLQDETEADRLPLVERALGKETDAEIKGLLERVRANLQLNSKDKKVRVAAIASLASSVNPNTKIILLGMLAKKDGEFVEKDADIRFEAQKSLKEVEGRLATGERIGQAFSGVSLGSILLLAALGLAITYGLMGVINMAHGELIMIGAYTTYVVQKLLRANAPDLFDWYLLAAVPASFMVAAAGRA